MANDPKKFRYDSAPQHKKPPEGLAPTVNKGGDKKEEKSKKELTAEQQERRKALLAKMQQNIQAEEEKEQDEQSTLEQANLPYDHEDHHPAEDVPEEEQGEISKYRMTLSDALGAPHMKSIRFGVIGSGQCGGRLAEQFARFGYPVSVINTAEQDLAYLDIPESHKLLMPYALGGAGKNLLIGQQAANENKEAICKLLETSMDDVDQVLVTLGGGGGTGGGSVVPLLEAIMNTEAISGLPIVVIYTLPMNDEGAAAKSNAVKTLERIAAMVNDDLISSLIIVDNAKIQQHYPNVSVKDFWSLANFDIVNHFNMFNTVSKCGTNYDALDPMDFANIISTGGCLIYGRVEVPVVHQGEIVLDEDKLAKALIRGVNEGTLAEGFDVTQSVNIGVIITGSEEVLSQIPAMNVNYAFNMLSEHVGEDCSIYRGMYADDTATDSLTVYTIFAGLGLPSQRITRLKDEASNALERIESKKKKTKLSMSADDQQQKQDDYAQMRQKNTSIGRMIQRRRRGR